MKRFMSAILVLCMLISFSIPAYAGDTISNGKQTEGNTSDMVDAAGGSASWGGGLGGKITVELPEGVGSAEDWQKKTGGSSTTGPAMGSGTVPSGSPLCPDLNDPNWIQKQKDWADKDPDGFAKSVSEACYGDPSVEEIKDSIAKGNYPTVKYEPTADITWNGQKESMTSMDFLNRLWPDADPKPETMGGNLQDIMNALTTTYGLPAGVGTNPNDPSNPVSFLAILMTGGKFDGKNWVKVDGVTSLAQLMDEWAKRGGNAYISFEDFLAGELGLDPDDPIPPPPPPVKIDSWKSKPKAFAEIKNDTYTAARSSEKWEAMAGIPHDEKLYYDAGASNLSGEYIAEQVNNVTTGAPSVESKVDHIGPDCDDGSCNVSGCRHSSHPRCSGHGPDKDGDYTYHSHGNDDAPGCTEKYTHCTVSWENYPSGITNYYKVKGYDTKEVTTLEQPVPYLANGSLNLSPDQIKKATSVVNSLPGGSWKVDGYSESFNCTIDGCNNSKTSLQGWLDGHKVGGDALAIFQTDKLTITDRDGNTYEPWEGFDIGIFVQSYEAPSSGCGTFKVNVAWSPIGGGESLQCSKDEMADYVQRFTSFHKYDVTNFMPGESNWPEETHFEVCGYNGKWDTKERRDCKKHKHLYYEDNLSFTDRIVNGEKETPAGTVTYVQFSNSNGGVGANAEPSTITEYEMGYGHPNNVVVHSPVALNTFFISCDLLPYDQRTSATKPADGGQHWITPSMDFQVNTDWIWQKNVEEPKKGIGQTTTKKGNGYIYKLDTLRWIEEKYYRFPFEVIYGGDSKRYDANAWISIPPDEKKSNFTLPVSEEEVPQAKYDGIVIAKNSPHRGNPQAAWDEQAEHTQNFTRDCGCQGDKEAPHGALNTNNVDVLGRIGNFTIDYTPDPNWSMFFSQKVTPEKWLVPNLVPEVNAKAYNKFLGPHHDIFDRMWWQIKDNLDEGFATEKWAHGLDSYTSIPHYAKGHLGGLLPAAPGKNLESVQDLLQFEPIKMGYPVWWSIETIGNYGTSVARLQVHPKFYLFDTKAATPGSQQVDVYSKVGSSYKKIHDSKNRTETDYKLNYSTKLTHDERRLGQVEKDLTKMVVGAGDYSDMFNPANVRWLGTPNEMILTKTLRTFFGTQTFEGANHQPNETSNGTPLSHAEQAQRWHGTLLVPSSAKFTKPGEKDFIDTEGKYLMVVLEFTTLDANPWNIQTEGRLSIGSNREVYFPWFEFKTPDKPKDVPPEHTINIPPDTVVVFDPNNPSLNDVQIHGTY